MSAGGCSRANEAALVRLNRAKQIRSSVRVQVRLPPQKLQRAGLYFDLTPFPTTKYPEVSLNV